MPSLLLTLDELEEIAHAVAAYKFSFQFDQGTRKVLDNILRKIFEEKLMLKVE